MYTTSLFIYTTSLYAYLMYYTPALCTAPVDVLQMFTATCR